MTDSLELLLLIRDKAPERYEAAALRWHARLVHEAWLGFAEGHAVLALLAALPETRTAAPAR